MDIKVIPTTVNLTIYRGDDVDLLLKVRLPEELDIKDISFAMSFGSGSSSSLLYTSPSPRDAMLSRMPSSA